MTGYCSPPKKRGTLHAMDIHEIYEAPAMTELGDLADLTQGSATLLVDTDVITTGSV